MFNGSFRDECLNLHWFESLEEAEVIIEAWRRDNNESRLETRVSIGFQTDTPLVNWTVLC